MYTGRTQNAEDMRMKCKECAEGKKYAEGSILCIQYGIIIRADHECIREGRRRREREDESDQRDSTEETGFQDNEWEAIDRMQGLLP